MYNIEMIDAIEDLLFEIECADSCSKCVFDTMQTGDTCAHTEMMGLISDVKLKVKNKVME